MTEEHRMKPWVHAIITSTENHNLSARLNIIQCKGGRVLGRIRSNWNTTELRGIEEEDVIAIVVAFVVVGI